MAWVIGLFALGIGVGLGVLLARTVFASNNKQREEALTEELETAKAEFQDYQKQVNQHFQQSSELVFELTQNYRKVYEHLASGAQSLCLDPPKHFNVDPSKGALYEEEKEQLTHQAEEATETAESAKAEAAPAEKAETATEEAAKTEVAAEEKTETAAEEAVKTEAAAEETTAKAETEETAAPTEAKAGAEEAEKTSAEAAPQEQAATEQAEEKAAAAGEAESEKPTPPPTEVKGEKEQPTIH